MSELTRSQVAELKDELHRQLAKLKKSMAVTEESVKPVALDQQAVGRLSRMDSMQSQRMAQGLQEREIVKLALIQEALRRIDAGTFGVCTECGNGVPFERLLVFPETGTCTACG
jgi:DnaK suppressor protein